MEELQAWLALYTVPQCGFATVQKLLKVFHTPAAILSASSQELRRTGIPESLTIGLKNPDWPEIERCLAWQKKTACHIVHWQDPRYPPLLGEIASPPLILFVMGEIALLQRDQLAIVGTRKPTPVGLETAYQFAYELAQQGLVITSGLARGIDSAGHKGCLAGSGQTLAILGSGLDKIYPSAHQKLAQHIIEKGGALISEFFPNAPPKAEHFPRRNRIISGLGLGVIVVEAALRSGSLITARYALEQGREVFAVPGSIRNPFSRGCHALLRQGAALVENSQDVLLALSFLPRLTADTLRSFQKGNTHHELDSDGRKLVECLGFETTSLDTLVMRTGLSADKLLAQLTLLELQGYISAVPGGYARK
jgi:DNA processing protein